MKKSALLLPITTLATATFMIGFIVAGFAILQIDKTLPDAQSIKNVELKIPLRVYSADNLLISEFGDERRKPVSIDEIPRALIDAVLASEDDRFFSHKGIDPSGIVRAAISNFRAGESQQGASTITMQVARNFFLTPEKTYIRKLREILLAIKLEQILNKNDILSLYLNKIFLGHRAYGFGAAADVYYGKSLHELSLAETAMLAGLPKAPSSNNPLRNATRAIKRRNYVLNRLLELKKIDQATFQQASAQPITAKKHHRGVELAAPHIAEMVRAKLIEEFGEQAYWQGLHVVTTIQAKQQRAANDSLRQGLKAYDQRHGFRGAIAHIDFDDIKIDPNNPILSYIDILSGYPNSQEQLPALVTAVDSDKALVYIKQTGERQLLIEQAKWAKRYKTADLIGDRPESMTQLLTVGDIVYVEPINVTDASTDKPDNLDSTAQTIQEWRLSQIPNVSGALISMEPDSGRILSLVGGYDFFLNKYNRAVQSIRQPGSNIKPFIYSASLDHAFTPASLISGAPIVMTDPIHGTVWRPENYSGKFFGPTRMREALGKSLNLVSIRLLRAIGIPTAREYLERFGIDMRRFSPTLTMALGAGGITPLEMLSAYSVLANTGYKIEPYFIEYITDREGKVFYRAKQAEFCDACYLDYLPSEEMEDPGVESAVDTELPDVIDPIPEETESPQDNDADSVVEFYQAPRVMSSANNFLTVSMMKDVIQRGTARKALVLNRLDLAGKTGTTNDYIDAWFSGFNSKVATTVWVGFDDPATMGRGEAGSVAALPIWIDYMRTGLEDVEQDSELVPEYIEQGWVDRSTGERVDETEVNAIEEYFVIDELVPEKTVVNNTDKLTEPLLDDDLEPEPIYPEVPEERIIESSEDTEGLF